MTDSSPKRISRLAVQSRRQEIEQQLGMYGLARGPRRLFRGERTVDFEQARLSRLRAALEGLGPIFSSFGLYLSARADLWAAKDCLELAKIPDKAAATPAQSITRLLHSEIHPRTEGAFNTFDEDPFESRLLYQSHYAQLSNGRDVIVKFVHPEAEEQLVYDVDLLPLLKDALAGCGLNDLSFQNAVTDFSHTLQQQMNFSFEARAFKALAQDADEYDALRTPEVYGPLSSSKILVIERLKGLRLNELMSSLLEPGSDTPRALLGIVGFERNELARLLCEVWLRQALLGRNFPVGVRPGNILILPGKRIAFTGGAFAGLPSEPQANLWDYLLAAANDNSDKACSCLLKEMRKEGPAARDNVLQRFRQAMPFRDGGWDACDDRQSLAELLFVHWRFATDCGYTPQMHLPGFYRGLFNIADIARRIAPQIDPLLEGVRDLRLVSGLSEFRKLISQRRLTEQMDGYAGLMMNLPQTLDEALTTLSEGHIRLKSEAADSRAQRAHSFSPVVVALLLVLGSVVLLSQYIAPSIAAGEWTNWINSIVFLVFGGLLLRAVSRG